MSLPPGSVDEDVFQLSVCRILHSFVRSSGQVLLLWHLMNSLSDLDATYREDSLAPIDDLIRFWGSEVKVTAGYRCGGGIHIDAGASNSIL